MSGPRSRPRSPKEFELIRKAVQRIRRVRLGGTQTRVKETTSFVEETCRQLETWANVIDGGSPVSPEEVAEVFVECDEPVSFPSTNGLAKLPSPRPSGSSGSPRPSGPSGSPHLSGSPHPSGPFGSPRPSGSSGSPRPFSSLPGLYSPREPEDLTKRLQELRNEHSPKQVEEDDEWEIIDTPMIFYLNLFLFLLKLFSSSVSLKKKIDDIVKTEGLSNVKLHAKFDLDKFNKLISEKIIVAEDFRSDSMFNLYSSLEEKLLLDYINENILIGRNFSSAVIAYVLVKTKFDNTHDYVKTTLCELDTYFKYLF